MKRYLMLLHIMKMQIKTIVENDFPTLSWLNEGKNLSTDVCEDKEQLEFSYIVVENTKWFNHTGK